jgi:carboxyl-terminal processing protease
MRKVFLVLFGAAVGVALALVATEPRLALIGADAKPAAASKTHHLLELFTDLFVFVRARYVEKPDDAEMTKAAINGMLSRLDDSAYADAKTYEHPEVCGTSGDCPTGNIGLDVTMQDGHLTIISAIDDTPAAKAGLMAGDIIVELDDEPTQGLTLAQAVDKLRGEIGTTAQLYVVRPGASKPLEVSIKREAISSVSVRSHAEGDDVGYIRIAQFDAQTPEKLEKALADVAAKISPDLLKGYVLDLRNTPGGLLDAAVTVADDFLDAGEIVSIGGRDAAKVQAFSAKPGDLAKGKPVIVLINAGSASAAEVVAGALQDHKRAKIVGTRSFGDGFVSTWIPLGPGRGAIRLATGRYLTPSGRLIKDKGIPPDVEVMQDLPTDPKADAKSKSSEKPLLQSYIPPDAKADKALNRAYDLLRGTKTDAAAQPAKAPVPN